MKFFVSYTTRDKEVSTELLSYVYAKLKVIGSVFIDIINNDSIDKQKRVFDELDNSDVLIVIGSQSIADSYWVNLEIERAWVTRNWWKPLFGTLLGVIVINSFLMYKYEFKKHNFNNTSDMMNFFEFVDVLALQLIKNNELENTRRLRHSGELRKMTLPMVNSIFPKIFMFNC